MLRRAIFMLIMVLAMVGLAGCPDQTKSQSSGPVAPPVPAPAPAPAAPQAKTASADGMYYDETGCQYFKIGDTGRLRPFFAYCAVPVSGATNPSWDFYLYSDPAKKFVYRQEYPPGLDSYAFRYWYETKTLTRQLTSGQGEIEQCWITNSRCEWITSAEYVQRINQQLQQQKIDRAKAQAEQQASQRAAEISLENTRQLFTFAQQHGMDATRVWIAPNCNSSYNGCR